MKKSLFAWGLLLPFLILAEARAIEMTAIPELGYSNSDGIIYGLGARADFALSDHWQIGGGAALSEYALSGTSISWFDLGPTYNFSADPLRSYSLSAGAGYANHYPRISDSGSWIGGLRFAKRFLLSEKYQITYRPSLELIVGRESVEVRLSLMNFSIIF